MAYSIIPIFYNCRFSILVFIENLSACNKLCLAIVFQGYQLLCYKLCFISNDHILTTIQLLTNKVDILYETEEVVNCILVYLGANNHCNYVICLQCIFTFNFHHHHQRHRVYMCLALKWQYTKWKLRRRSLDYSAHSLYKSFE